MTQLLLVSIFLLIKCFVHILHLIISLMIPQTISYICCLSIHLNTCSLLSLKQTTKKKGKAKLIDQPKLDSMLFYVFCFGIFFLYLDLKNVSLLFYIDVWASSIILSSLIHFNWFLYKMTEIQFHSSVNEHPIFFWRTICLFFLSMQNFDNLPKI